MGAADLPGRGVLRRFAPAKINLYLHVLGRGDDGYHRLDSLVAFAGVGDTIEVAPADDLGLTLSGPQSAALTATGDNLVLRAARRLRAEAGVTQGAAIRLNKILPVAAGIGGGSADAAATLHALAALWRIDAGADDLARVGLALGADVPVCLAGRAVFVGGIGEDLTPAPALPAAHLVLVNPGAALATKEVFAARQGPFGQTARFTAAPADAAALAGVLAARANDLEAPARRLLPAVDDVRAALAAEDGCLLARMSGSGATCFGLFAAETEAAAAAARLSRHAPEWWVAAAPLVNRFETLANAV